MKATGILLLVAAVLLGYGSVTDHWFDDSGKGLTAHQGLLASEVCGPDLGTDRLETYAQHVRTGRAEPAEWRCERDFVVPMVARAKRAIHVVEWAALVIGCLAGLAIAILAMVAGIRALDGRPASRRTATAIAIVPAVGLVCAMAVSRMGDLADSKLEYGALVYAAGALLALVAGIRLRGATR